jgi:CRP-like cAMP-binding protein
LLSTLEDADQEKSLSQRDTPPAPNVKDHQEPFTQPEFETLVANFQSTDVIEEIERAANIAHRLMSIKKVPLSSIKNITLSTIEKIILLKEVSFFQGMTIEQLKVLARVCKEEFFPEDSLIFNQGDPGGTLYTIASGRVGIDQEQRKGSFVRVNTYRAGSYIGEVTLFDKSPRTAACIAIQDTLTLRLDHEPLMALARQHPELSLELIHALNRRLRESYERVAELTRARPDQLKKFFDQFTENETEE